MADDTQTTEKHAIHGYVCPDVHGRFEAYRRAVGLTSSSALLTLLVLREIKLQRLEPTGGRARDAQGGTARDAKDSAYIDSGKAQAFKALTDKLGRSASDCAAALVEQELDERWLHAALAQPSAAGDAR